MRRGAILLLIPDRLLGKVEETLQPVDRFGVQLAQHRLGRLRKKIPVARIGDLQGQFIQESPGQIEVLVDGVVTCLQCTDARARGFIQVLLRVGGQLGLCPSMSANLLGLLDEIE